jgi:hypothetical protein
MVEASSAADGRRPPDGARAYRGTMARFAARPIGGEASSSATGEAMSDTSSPYRTAKHRDFAAMIETQRYLQRTSDFDKIIGRGNEHFWNPEDPDYIDYAEPLSVGEPIMPIWFFHELQTAVADRLDEGQQVEFANECSRWTISSLLHGEQGALSLSVSLCELFLDPGAQEYAAHQLHEEARHVRAFTKYIQARFGGRILPAGDTLSTLLQELVASELPYKKIVGMQLIVEGLAMGALNLLHTQSADPLLRRLCQLVLTDEAFHHQFGQIWAHGFLPTITEQEHNDVEDWALRCFNALRENLTSPYQKRVIYSQFGLDWQWVQGALREGIPEARRKRMLTKPHNIHRTIVKTLLKSGVITERTWQHYAEWIDLAALSKEDDRLPGIQVAEDGLRFLTDVNGGKRKLIRKIT